MLNRIKPFDTVSGRNWKYTQGGLLFDVNGNEVGCDGKSVGEEVAAPTPVEPAPGVMTVGKVDPVSPEDMSDDELKDELRAGDISLRGGFKRAALIDKVEDLRNVES
jgi:hypothetical protein